MSLLVNRARMATATTGTGTITLGLAIAGYLSFNEAGVPNGGTVSYVLEDGLNFEVGRGVYNSSTFTLTRGAIIVSKINGQAADTSPISLSGSAVVFLTAAAEDLLSRNAAIGDNAILRGDGGAGGTQSSDVTISDTNIMNGAIAVGVNATADATNRLSVASAAVLFNHEGAGTQIKVNKAAAGNTASHLFQTNFSARAEIGLLGSDDLSFKVSPDGTNFFTGLLIDKDDGFVSLPIGVLDFPERAAPASPIANVARAYAVDDGADVTTLAMKDNAGNVVALSHFLQAGAGAITRTQQGKLRDAISAFDFIPVAEQAAILAGTSTTDVFSYLRSAATAAAGGTLFLPEGLYNCSDDVPIPANTHVIGYGATIKATNGNVSNPVLIEIANHAGNVLIEGVTFDGNIANIAGLNNVVTVFTTAAVRFENCKWQNCKGIAVIFSTVTRSGVRNSIFDTNGNYDLTSASLADRRAATVFTGTCQYCFANYNRLEDTGLDSISATTGSSDLEVIGNVIKGTRAACIFVSNTARPIIANNICTGAVTPSDLSGGVGIDIPGTTDGVVAGNICYLNDSTGILLANAKRMTVVGNICRNNQLATSFTPNHLGGICIAVTSGETVRDLTLTGNQCYDDRAAASVKQRFAIGVLDGGGSFIDIRIDKSNRLIGYDSSGNETATDVFQTGDLGYSGRDVGRRDLDLPAVQRYDARNNEITMSRIGLSDEVYDRAAGDAQTTGGVGAINKSSTNYFSRQSRVRALSTAGTGANAGIRGRDFKYRQDACRTAIRFGWIDFQSNAAAFIGLKPDAAHGNADPSSFLNCIGIGIDAGQTTWRLLHNDGSGSATATDLGANFPANTDATDVYELEIWWGDAASTVHWKLTRCNTGHIARGQIDTNLPSLTTVLVSHVVANTRTGSAAIDIACMAMMSEFS